VTAIRSREGETGELDSYLRRQGTYWLAAHRAISGTGGFWLSPLAVISEGDYLLALHNGERLVLLRGSQVLPVEEMPQPFASDFIGGLSAVLFLPVPDKPPLPTVVVFDAILPCSTSNGETPYARLGARLGFRARSTVQNATLAMMRTGPESLDLAGLTADGVVFWTALGWEQGRLETRATASAPTPGGYTATTFAGANLLAAVADTRIDWYRGVSGRLTLWRSTRLDLPDAVACHLSSRTHELMIVLADGQVVCVPVPS
jgi:hypothetical protein